jgi:S-adenosylmethionine:tRNA ribosyltransferase-isomerase
LQLLALQLCREYRTGTGNVRLSELQYALPRELIAQRPAEPRDAARLLVLDRSNGSIAHCVFRDIGDYLRPGDCLVLNDTRVIPARFFCRRQSGGRIEGLFLHEQRGTWRALLKPSARLKVGERLRCAADDTEFVLCERHERGEWSLRPEPLVPPLDLLRRIGQTPLPPYIQRDPAPDASDAERYQTVYARRAGAVAAPTAGLHFTPELLDRLRETGVRRADVTLHVGVGTFAPIEVGELAQHQMHAEWFEVNQEAVAAMRTARAAGGRIVAVGTTSARVLESLELDRQAGPTGGAAAGGWTNLFIYPPYRFRNLDHLLTNFHLPGTTLLALVMAFATPRQIHAAYRAAIDRRYRFYSYGDAMLIL